MTGRKKIARIVLFVGVALFVMMCLQIAVGLLIMLGWIGR